MKYLFFVLLLITSCKSPKLEYNSETVYLVVQSPKYNLYLSKNDMINSLEKKHIKSNGEIKYDCIKKLYQTDSIKTDDDYILDKSNILDKIEEADAFYFSAIDLFKKHKVLVYDKIQEKWISKYKIRHHVYKNVEHHAYYEVLYNDSLIYYCRDDIES